jgi:hypothetical protein
MSLSPRLAERRRAVAAALLTAMLAAATATHRQSDFDDDSPGRGSWTVVSTHDPSSHALHLHAVLRVVEDAPCWACQSHRFSILAGAAPIPRPLTASRPLGTMPSRAARAVAGYTRRSRAPPSPRRSET